jgi:hypothetical protein
MNRNEAQVEKRVKALGLHLAISYSDDEEEEDGTQPQLGKGSSSSSSRNGAREGRIVLSDDDDAEEEGGVEVDTHRQQSQSQSQPRARGRTQRRSGLAEGEGEQPTQLDVDGIFSSPGSVDLSPADGGGFRDSSMFSPTAAAFVRGGGSFDHEDATELQDLMVGSPAPNMRSFIGSAPMTAPTPSAGSVGSSSVVTTGQTASSAEHGQRENAGSSSSRSSSVKKPKLRADFSATGPTQLDSTGTQDGRGGGPKGVERAIWDLEDGALDAFEARSNALLNLHGAGGDSEDDGEHEQQKQQQPVKKRARSAGLVKQKKRGGGNSQRSGNNSDEDASFEDNLFGDATGADKSFDAGDEISASVKGATKLTKNQEREALIKRKSVRIDSDDDEL